MTSTCVRCGRPTVDGYACTACAQELAQSLVAASGHAEDAEAVLSRQTRYGAGGRGGSGEGKTPDFKRSASYDRIVEKIGGWARIVIEHTGRQPKWKPYLGPLCSPARPGDDERQGNRCDHDSCATARRRERPGSLAVDAAWLGQARQAEFLRKHPAADEAFKDLIKACDDLAWLVDRPADREIVGVCDCGKVLYAPDWRRVIQCPQPTCELVWNVDESREILRRHLDDKLVTAAEAAHLGQYLDTDRTQEQIRKLINKWAERLLIEAHSAIDGDAVYRFGEIFERLATTQRRQRRETAEMGA